jgi:hypothetical protein
MLMEILTAMSMEIQKDLNLDCMKNQSMAMLKVIETDFQTEIQTN